jgi:D-alanine-D-alanine ligase
VESEAELRERAKYVIHSYHQPALIENFLPGREFTVGQLGRSDAKLFSRHPHWYEADGFHRLPILELKTEKSSTPGIYSHAAKAQQLGEKGAPEYVCPADVEPELAKKLHHLALRGHYILFATDISRVDFRLDAEGNPRLIEINPLPGLTPGYSDLCLQAAAEGIRYEDLILEILYLAAGRWGLLEPRELPPEQTTKARKKQ